MSEIDKEQFSILIPNDSMRSYFDIAITEFDLAMQNFFNRAYSKFKAEDQYLNALPSKPAIEAANATWYLILNCFAPKRGKDCSPDTLRASLLKFASLNRTINDIESILDIHQQVNEFVLSWEYDLAPLKYIEEESSILPVLLDVFSLQERDLPKDLLKCARLVCLMYIKTQAPYDTQIEEDLVCHMHPSSNAIAAAILYLIWAKKIKLNLRIIGETNQNILVYKELLKFSETIDSLDTFQLSHLTNWGFPEQLYKYITTLYVINVSSTTPSKENAVSILRIKQYKLKIQRKTYRLLKKLSVQDAYSVMETFYIIVRAQFSA